MKRVIGSLLVAGFASTASAHTAPSSVTVIQFRPDHEADILAGTNFGLLVSHDAGATWQWICEDAVGYAGLYLPDYAYSGSGAIFATTFGGLRVNRDSCTFEAATPSTAFVSQVELGPDRAVYAAYADPADTHLYKSTDDGVTFPAKSAPDTNPDDWWQSLVVAPSDPSRVYLSGYWLVGSTKTFLLFASNDGGATFAPRPTDSFTTINETIIEIAGVAADNPDLVYARGASETPTAAASLYRSSDAGMTWTKILTEPEPIGFVVRQNGDLVAGTQLSGTHVSHDRGATWSPVPGAPHINCLTETAGVVWACTLDGDIAAMNGMPAIPGDGFGLMKSADLATWTGVLHYHDITAPVSCPSGTTQHDTCPDAWCAIALKFGITSDPLACTRASAGDTTLPPPNGGCCQSGRDARGSLVLALAALTLIRRRRLRVRAKPSMAKLGTWLEILDSIHDLSL
ncbi:MAG: hypothetical protein JWO36_5157 [Myxococcales bacterium]|nr:hypothetical protein [Myxococcales bacterium]